MNRNGSLGSNGAARPGHLHPALMANRQHQDVIMPGGDGFPLSHYQNMPKDQVDWAALAQQWIKMRESWMQPVSAYIPSPPPPPTFDRDTDVQLSDHSFDTAYLSSSVQYEEQGEAPMEVEKDDETLEELLVPPMPPSITEAAGPDGSGRSHSSTGWSSLGNTELPAPNPTNSLKHQKHLTNNPATSDERGGESKVNSFAATSASSNASAAVALWQAKNSHLFQTGMVKNAPSGRPGASRSMGTNKRDGALDIKSSPLPGLMDREIKISVPSTVESTAFVSNDAKNFMSGGSTASINEAKRKLLPAWIREGLEKMEKEKQRQAEREQERRQWAEDVEQRKSYFRLSPMPEHPIKLENEPEVNVPARRPSERNVDEIEKMTKKILTEILMETTGEVLLSIAKETLDKVQKRKAKLARSKTGLAICTGGLGLGIYGDSDDDDDEDEEEQQTESRSKKSTGAEKCADVGSDGNSSEDDVSDREAEQQLKDKIRMRQLDFKVTAGEIEQWLENTKIHQHTASKGQRKTDVPEEGSDKEIGNQRNADEGEIEREAAHEDADSGDGFGGDFTKGFLQKCNTRHGNAHSINNENVTWKRRDKRVSRFSDLRDTVRTTHITHVSIVSPVANTRPNSETGVSSVTPVSRADAMPAAVQLNQRHNTYALIRQREPSQTIYSIGAGSLSLPPVEPHPGSSVIGGVTATAGRTGEVDGRTLTTEPDKVHRRKEADGEKKPHYRERIQSSTESNRRRDRRGDSYRRKYHNRSRSGSSRSSWSRSATPYSRSSRSRSREHSGSRSRSSRSHSSKRHTMATSGSRYSSRQRDRNRRRERDRSSSRGRSRSRDSGSRRRRGEHSRRSRSRSRSRSRGSSSSKYSSRRRF